jgi:hypothetical protein
LVVSWDPGTDARLGKGALWVITGVEKDRLILEMKEGDRMRRDTYERMGG